MQSIQPVDAFRTRIQSSARYPWWALGILLVGFFSTGISITILTAVLPAIARELGVGTATITWVVTGPMLATGILTPTMGKAGDLYGRKRVYLIGWTTSMAFAGLAALSWNAGALITFRLLGAAAGAATGPASMAIILSAFGRADRVKAVGWWSFMGAGAPVLGLVVGGPLVDVVGWRWIFGIQPPLGAGGILLAWFLLQDDVPTEHPRFDLAGSATIGLTMGAGLYALNRGGSAGWGRADVVIAFALVPVLAIAFVLRERSHDAPLIPLAYFRKRDVSIPVAIQAIAHVPYMGAFFLTPFFVQGVLGYDNTRTAFALLPRPLTNAVLSVAAGYVAVRLGERFCAVGGGTALVIGMLLFAALGRDASFWQVVVAQSLTGAGLGLAYPALASTVANAVDESDFGTISAVENMAWTVGSVAGMQLLQTVQQVRAERVGQAAAFGDVFLLASAVAVVALVLSGFVRSMHRTGPVPPTESPEAPVLPEPVDR